MTASPVINYSYHIFLVSSFGWDETQCIKEESVFQFCNTSNWCSASFTGRNWCSKYMILILGWQEWCSCCTQVDIILVNLVLKVSCCQFQKKAWCWRSLEGHSAHANIQWHIIAYYCNMNISSLRIGECQPVYFLGEIRRNFLLWIINNEEVVCIFPCFPFLDIIGCDGLC